MNSAVAIERALVAVPPWSRKNASAEIMHAYQLVTAAAMPVKRPGLTHVVVDGVAYKADRVCGALRVRGMPLARFLARSADRPKGQTP